MKKVFLLNINTENNFNRYEILNILCVFHFLNKDKKINIEIREFNKISEIENFDQKSDYYVFFSRENIAKELGYRLKKKYADCEIFFYHEYYNKFVSKENNPFIIINGNNANSLIERILYNKPIHSLKGIIYTLNNTIIIDNNNNLLNYSDIDLLDYNKYPNENYIKRNVFKDSFGNNIDAGITFLSYGCDQKCAFCVNPVFFKKNIVFRNINSVINDILFFKQKGINVISFEDHDFLFNEKRLKNFNLELKRKKINIKYRAHGSLRLINEKNIKLLKEGGCFRLDIGIESVCTDIQKKINKPSDEKEIFQKLDLLKKNKISPFVLLIVGFPFEDENSLKKMQSFINILREKKIDFAISKYKNIPGSDLYMENLEKEPIFDQKINEFIYKNTGIKKNIINQKNYFLEKDNFLNIDVKDFIDGSFEPIPLNHWNGDDICNTGWSHLVGRFNGFIKYNFNSTPCKLKKIQISFTCCTQNENNGVLEVFLNGEKHSVCIPKKDSLGKDITVVFENVKLNSNNELVLKSNDGNGLTVFDEEIQGKGKRGIKISNK